MKKILVVAPHRPGRSPSQRFRIEQFIPLLEKNGFVVDYAFLVKEKEDKLLYSKGKGFKKFFLLIKFFFRRLKHVLNAGSYDIIFIQREAFFIGPAFFEKLLSLKKAKLIYDFDDSIWLPNISDANQSFNAFKYYSKIKSIIKMSDVVIVGNDFLKDYSVKYNENTIVIPTTVDTDYYCPQTTEKNGNKICIGWTGSHTTIKHFSLIIPLLKKIQEKYSDKVEFLLIGDENYKCDLKNFKAISWQRDTEIADLSKIDIGIMPLPDDEWSKGKCGFKGIQYMAMAIPAVMSDIGVNGKIIQDGLNGFLARTDEEWIEKLTLLIENSELREKIGQKGRETIVKEYSAFIAGEKLLKIFTELA